MNLENALRLEINLLSFLVLLIIFISSRRKTREKEFVGSILFFHILISILVILVADSLAWILDGTRGTAARIGLYILDSLYYAIQVVPFASFVLYVDKFTRPEPEVLGSATFYVTSGISALAALVALSTPWTKLFFTIDASNHYVRGPLFYMFTLVNVALGLYPLALLIKRRASISRRSFLTLILYPVIPTIGGLFQYITYGNNLLWPATSVSLLLVFINVQNRRIEIDFLTGAYNRFSLGEYESSLSRRPGEVPSISGIMLDLDGFKEINDRFGHSVGDEALVVASKILSKSVRKKDFVARYGGDEFLVILETDDKKTLDEVVARIRASFIEGNLGQNRPYNLSVSLGAGTFDPKIDENFDRFIHRLDLAMYVEKRGAFAQLPAKPKVVPG